MASNIKRLAIDQKLDMSLDEIIAREGITRYEDGRGGSEYRPNRRKRSMSKSMAELRASVGIDSSFKGYGYDPFDDVIQHRRPSASSGGGGQSGNRANSHYPDHCGRVVVDNLKYEVNDDDLRLLFQTFGSLKRVGVNYRRDGRADGTALVVFERKEEAAQAVAALNNEPLDGRPMRLCLLDVDLSPFARDPVMVARDALVVERLRAASEAFYRSGGVIGAGCAPPRDDSLIIGKSYFPGGIFSGESSDGSADGIAATAAADHLSPNRHVWTESATNYDAINGSDDDNEEFPQKRFRANDE